MFDAPTSERDAGNGAAGSRCTSAPGGKGGVGYHGPQSKEQNNHSLGLGRGGHGEAALLPPSYLISDIQEEVQESSNYDTASWQEMQLLHAAGLGRPLLSMATDDQPHM